MADFSDMDMDFDEQLGLEDEHLAGIGEMDYMDVPTEFEPIAEPVVLPERQNDENRHVVHTMEEDVVSEEPTSLAVETPIVENSPPRRHRLRQKTTVAESTPPGRHRLRKKTKVLGSPSPLCTGLGDMHLEQDEGWWLDLDNRGKWKWAWNRIAKSGFREYMTEMEKKDEDAVSRFPAEFSKLNKIDKEEVARFWIMQGSGQFQTAVVKNWITRNFMSTKATEAAETPGARRVRSKQLMFTCQGDWGF